jgi:hypothetical protein
MSGTPETLEAIERWHQGKINIFDELARMETERDEARIQYQSTLALAEALVKGLKELKAELSQKELPDIPGWPCGFSKKQSEQDA